MTTTAPLVLPPNLTQVDVAAARQVLAQVLRHNPDLPLHIVTEASTALVLFNELAPPAAIPPEPVAAKVAPDDPITEWLFRIVERNDRQPIGIRAGWLFAAAKRVTGPAFIDMLAVELGGELLEVKPRLSHDLAGLLEILKGLPKR